MTFILVPEHGDDVQVNGWNWRPTLELLYSGGLLSDELYQRMGAQGCGGAVDEDLAIKIAEVVEAKLMEMHTGDRMLANLSTTSEPKTNRIDAPDIYSATYDWLKEFGAFCRRCGGFEVV